MELSNISQDKIAATLIIKNDQSKSKSKGLFTKKKDFVYYKTKADIVKEASNEECKDIDKCICITRLEGVISICHKLKKSKLWVKCITNPFYCVSIHVT